MAKRAKIITVIIALIVIIGGVSALFIPSLRIYGKIKKSCPDINRKIEKYNFSEYVCPDDFVPMKKYDFVIDVPKALHLKDADSKSELAKNHYVTDDKSYSLVFIISDSGLSTRFEDYKKTADTLGKKAVKSSVEDYDYFYDDLYMLFDMTLDDYEMLNIKKRKPFYNLARDKQTLLDAYTDVYRFENDDYVGTFYCLGVEGLSNKYVADLFEKENHQFIGAGIMLTAPSMEDAFNIFNSIRPADEQE